MQEKDERCENEFKHSSRLYCLHWNPVKPAELVTSADDKYIRCCCYDVLLANPHYEASSLESLRSHQKVP